MARILSLWKSFLREGDERAMEWKCSEERASKSPEVEEHLVSLRSHRCHRCPEGEKEVREERGQIPEGLAGTFTLAAVQRTDNRRQKEQQRVNNISTDYSWDLSGSIGGDEKQSVSRYILKLLLSP